MRSPITFALALAVCAPLTVDAASICQKGNKVKLP
jgi:hypothetical protein